MAERVWPRFDRSGLYTVIYMFVGVVTRKDISSTYFLRLSCFLKVKTVYTMYIQLLCMFPILFLSEDIIWVEALLSTTIDSKLLYLVYSCQYIFRVPSAVVVLSDINWF